MKKSYKRLLLFELILVFILILNSFVSSILSSYNIVLFLFVALILFHKLFGFEKDRHRYIKDIIGEIFIVLLIYFILYYLFGIIIGFARTDNYYTLDGLVKFIIPTILTIILKEFFRYMVLTKSEGNNLLVVFSFILFVFMDITNPLYYNQFSSKYETFIFVALTLLPAISTNIACTYISTKTGYKPVIFYLLIMNLVNYLVPIVPNPNEYLLSIINLVFPFVVGYRVYLFFQKDSDKEIEIESKKMKIIPLVLSLCVVFGAVYFTSGYFRYHAIAIASGSMRPNIDKGDVVVIEKIDKNYDLLKEGQVIAYKYNGIIVVHRLINIIKYDDEHYYFYTKGDANLESDNYAITEDMVIGIVNLKVPYIGLPTVWLNEL